MVAVLATLLAAVPELLAKAALASLAEPALARLARLARRLRPVREFPRTIGGTLLMEPVDLHHHRVRRWRGCLRRAERAVIARVPRPVAPLTRPVLAALREVRDLLTSYQEGLWAAVEALHLNVAPYPPRGWARRRAFWRGVRAACPAAQIEGVRLLAA